MPIKDLQPIPLDAPHPGSRWNHWKATCVARVSSVGYHTETGELMVTYLEETSNLVFVRPLSMWTDTVAIGVQRFTPVVEPVQLAKHLERYERCECGRRLIDCTTFENPNAKHADRGEPEEEDDSDDDDRFRPMPDDDDELEEP